MKPKSKPKPFEKEARKLIEQVSLFNNYSSDLEIIRRALVRASKGTKSREKLGWAVELKTLESWSLLKPHFETGQQARDFQVQKCRGLTTRIVRVRYWEPEVIG